MRITKKQINMIIPFLLLFNGENNFLLVQFQF